MLHLQDLAKYGPQTKQITLKERLPSFLLSPCHLAVTYQIEAKENFYLIQLEVSGELTVLCQRCLHEYHLVYNNPTAIAVTRSDERAEQLLEYYECIVSSNYQIDLEDMVIDELHLYAPQFHQEAKDCNEEINQFLTEKTEPY